MTSSTSDTKDFTQIVEEVLIKLRESLETESFKFWFEKSISNDTLQRNSYDLEQIALRAITEAHNKEVERRLSTIKVKQHNGSAWVEKDMDWSV